jgi:cysteine desulfurase family protein (TIGR01976 family)
MTDTLRAASVAAIREHFPALERRHGGYPVAYFDGPGGTQVPRAVVEAMADYLVHHNANTHWAYPASQETDAILAGARAALGDFLNARPDEVVFGPNMTTLTFHLARALARSFRPGDEVVVTELDHHANVAPWKRAAAEFGLTVRTVAMRPEAGTLDWDDLSRAIGERTRLVAVGAASNALGTITDVAAVARLAHARGALVFVDAVHYAPHHLVDVRALDCDFLVCSAYKFYGPHVGVLYGRSSLLGSVDVPKLEPAPNTAPERCETGTQNHEGIAGAAAAVDFLASLADGPSRRARLETTFQALQAEGRARLEQLWQGLAAIDSVMLFGPPPDAPRTPTVSWTIAGLSPSEVARRLAGHGIFASHGHFYAQTVAERLGRAAEGFVRIGCACYTTEEDVDRLIDAVRAFKRGTA